MLNYLCFVIKHSLTPLRNINICTAMTLDFCHNSKTVEKGLQKLYMIEQT